jgi:hypothetical protein
MPSHIISPPAVQRVVPLSKPLGSSLSYVSVSATHGISTKPIAQVSKPVLSASKTAVPAPEHLVSKANTY